jgi:glyceraldehyde 3-phosphate dehydrogenase
MNQKTRVAINGFGRIGRAFFKIAMSRPEIELVAINDLGDPENLAYLLKFDSVYGRAGFDVEVVKEKKDVFLWINKDKKVSIFSEKAPKKLPWKELSVDVVIESTGLFTKYEDADDHIKAGAKKVIITAPAGSKPKNTKEATILLGVNDDKLEKCDVISNASCTTNSVATVLAVLDDSLGVEKAILNTVHAYTATQELVDSPSGKDMRRGRAGAINIIPSSTGASESTILALPTLKGKFEGVALRVPVPAGSVADLTFISKRNTTVEEVNQILKRASLEQRYHGILTTTEEEVVSQDIVGNPHAAIVDLNMTKVVGGDLIKVLSWYDNEAGYANTLVLQVIKLGALINYEK